MYKISVKKSQHTLCLYLGCRLLKEYPCVHAEANTGEWTKTVMKFEGGHTDRTLRPNAWFAFGATFDPGVYRWPAVGSTGPVVNVASEDPKEHWVVAETAERTGERSARVFVDGRWEEVWADGNPFGAAGIEFPDTSVVIHGSPKDRDGIERPVGPVGMDGDLQSRWESLHERMGCLRVQNDVILDLKRLIPVGTPVTIAP
jgi:hypothetical protein